MASYQKRETKTKGVVYDVYFRAMIDGHEKQIKLSGYKTKHDAEVAFRAWKPPAEVPSGASTVFDTAIEDYMQARGGDLAQGSLYGVRRVFDRHIIPTFGGKAISSVTRSAVVKWQNALWGDTDKNGDPTLKQSTCRQIRSDFRAFMSWAADVYGVADPFVGLKTPQRREDVAVRDVWSCPDFERFAACVKSDDLRLYFSVLFYSGCREGEALALYPSDFVKDGDAYIIKITKSAAMDRKSFNAVTAPKNTSSVRSVRLPDFMTDVISGYLQTATGPYMFGGDRYFSRSKVKTAFLKAISESGVKSIRIHDLRHSHATWLITEGMPVTAVSKRLGHANTTTTLNTYAHADAYADKLLNDLLASLPADFQAQARAEGVNFLPSGTGVTWTRQAGSETWEKS